MVEYAILLAHTSADFMSGLSGDLLAWASRVDWILLGYVVAGLILLRLVASLFRPSRRY